MPEDQIIAYNFIALTLLVSSAVVGTLDSDRSKWCIIAWMLAMGTIGSTDLLAHAARLPLASLLITISILLTFSLSRSTAAKCWLLLPQSWLVGFQSFRCLVELLLIMGYEHGIIPVQLTAYGHSYEWLIGLSALCLAPIAHSIPAVWLRLWSCLGLVSWLGGVLVHLFSLLSASQLVQQEHAWVFCYFPYIWLPTGLSSMALLGHLLLLRRLAKSQ